jgi:hypothetical protein
MANIDEPRAPATGKGEMNDDPDTRNADSDFDDLVIEVDESELEAEEATTHPPKS